MSHKCPNSDHLNQRLVVCEACSTAIETTEEDEKTMLQRQERFGDCDLGEKQTSACPNRRCREVLTFSDTSTPAVTVAAPAVGGRWNEKLWAALAWKWMSKKECGKEEWGSVSC